jgi:hypothetical protein
MNDWNESEVAFRCQQLSLRLERLAQNFLQMGSLIKDGADAKKVLEIVCECKAFLELTAIDLDVDSAYKLAQTQRQLSRWHLSWQDTWQSEAARREISNLSVMWANRIQEMAVVLV